MKTLKKIADVIATATDYAPGVMLVLAGLGLVVGGSTGILWY